MQSTVVGLFTGLFLGIVLVLGDFSDMLVVAFFGGLGFVVMKIVEGEIDVGEIIDRNKRTKR